MELTRRRKWIAAGAVVVAATAIGGGVVAATTSDDDDDKSTPITGEAFDRASAVALEHTGGGTVTETEIGDEEGAYEVEVTLEDGTQVDVHLDDDFVVLNAQPDHDETGDDD